MGKRSRSLQDGRSLYLLAYRCRHLYQLHLVRLNYRMDSLMLHRLRNRRGPKDWLNFG